MSLRNFDLIKQKIENQIKRSEVEIDPIHSQLTWKWVLKLNPNADLPLQISALGHDYDRSFSDRERREFHKSYAEYKQAHAKKSAEMVASLMEENNFTSEEVERTKNLIENHEVGGKGDLQVLTDADSLAFFEGNLPHYQKMHGKNTTKDKTTFMYKRMSDNAKNILNQSPFKISIVSDTPEV